MDRKDLREAGQENRGNNSLQICIMCEGHARVLLGQAPEAYLQISRSINSAYAALLAASWEERLIAKIASGQPV